MTGWRPEKDPAPFHLPPPLDQIDELAAVRGILIGCVISIVFWMAACTLVARWVVGV